MGGSSGSGVSVGIVDSGVDADHPDVGGVSEAVVVRAGDDDRPLADADGEPDVSGHGTACAALIRSIAPECELISVRVLGPDFTGTGRDLVAGLLWALQRGCRIVNLSLATTRREFAWPLQELVDDAYFNNAIVVASAHNMPVLSWPWRSSSVVSVASHDRGDSYEFHYNPQPPVEFYARGADLLRDAAHQRHLCADPRQAPAPDAVSGEVDSVRHREQRARPAQRGALVSAEERDRADR